MSINVTVRGNPISINRGKMVLSDADGIKSKELDRRRKLRLEQVREQSKQIASNIRNKVRKETKKQLSELEKKRGAELKCWQARKLLQLQQQYNECLHEVGSAYTQAALQPDTEKVLKEEHKKMTDVALQRGQIAAKKLEEKRQREELKKTAPLKRKKFSREIENARSTMVSNLNKKDRKSKSPFKSKSKPKKNVLANISITANTTSEESNLSESSINDEIEEPSPDSVVSSKSKSKSRKLSSKHKATEYESSSQDVTFETDDDKSKSKISNSSENLSSVQQKQLHDDTPHLDVSIDSYENEPRSLNRTSYDPKSFQETAYYNASRESVYEPRSYQDAQTKVPVDTRISDLISKRHQDNKNNYTLQGDLQHNSYRNRHHNPNSADVGMFDIEQPYNQCQICPPRIVNCHCNEKGPNVLQNNSRKDKNRTVRSHFIDCTSDTHPENQDRTERIPFINDRHVNGVRAEQVPVSSINEKYAKDSHLKSGLKPEVTYRLPGKNVHSGKYKVEGINYPTSSIKENIQPDSKRDIRLSPVRGVKQLSPVLKRATGTTQSSSNRNKVQYYDHNNRFTYEYNRRSDLVQHFDPQHTDRVILNKNDDEIKIDQQNTKRPIQQSEQVTILKDKICSARNESEILARLIAEENEEKRKLSEQEAKRQQEAEQRGKMAVEKEKTHRDYNELLKQLSTLQRKERLLQRRSTNSHLLDHRLQEKFKNRQKCIETAFERMYHGHQTPIITLDRVKKPENSNIEFETVDLSSDSPPTLNVADWDEMQETNVDESEQTLLSLLNRIRLERQMLIEEMNALTQNTKDRATQVSKQKNIDKLKNDTKVNTSTESNSSVNHSFESNTNDAANSKSSDNTQQCNESHRKFQQKQKKTEVKKIKKSKSSKTEKNYKADSENSQKKIILTSDANVQTSLNNIHETPEKDSNRSPEISSSNSSNNTYKGPEIIIKVNDKNKSQTIIVAPAKKKYVCVTEKGQKVESVNAEIKDVRLQREHGIIEQPIVTQEKQSTVNIQKPSDNNENEKLKTMVMSNNVPAKQTMNNISIGTASTSYMSPPQNFSVDSSAVEQMKDNKHNYKKESELNPKVRKLIDKLLTMSKQSIDELGVSSVSDVPTPDFSLVCTMENMPNDLKNSVCNSTTPHLDVSVSHPFLTDIEDQLPQLNNQQNAVLNRITTDASAVNMPSEIGIGHLLLDYDRLEKKIDDLTSVLNALRNERNNSNDKNLTSSDKELNSTSYLDLPANDHIIANKSSEETSNVSPKKQTSPFRENNLKQSNTEKHEITSQYINIFSDMSTQQQSNISFEQVESRNNDNKSPRTVDYGHKSSKMEQSFVPLLQGIPKIDLRNENIPGPSTSRGFDFSSSGSSSLFVPRRDEVKLPHMFLMSSTDSNTSNGFQRMTQSNHMASHRSKPPASLKRTALRHNIATDVALAHELSTIVELDSPAASKNISRFSEQSRNKSVVEQRDISSIVEKGEIEKKSSSESLPEILADILKAAKEIEDLDNEKLSENDSKNFSGSKTISDILSGIQHLSSSSSSSPDQIEALLKDMGLSWAASTLKKTEQSLALSSSSSSQDVSFRRLGIHFNFNTSNSNSSSGETNSKESVRKLPSSSVNDKSSPNMPQLVQKQTPDSTPPITGIQDVSNFPTSGKQSKNKSKRQTSTPIIENLTPSQTELYTGESDISSVHPTGNKNIDLTVPNLSLDIEKTLKKHRNSDNS